MTDCLNDAYAGVALPTALARKYPAASKELGWHYLFPASHLSRDPVDGALRRHHLDPTTLQKAVRATARQLQLGVIPCAIPLPPICWRGGRIFEPCRSNWAILMFEPHKFIPMCCKTAPMGYVALCLICNGWGAGRSVFQNEWPDAGTLPPLGYSS